MKNNDNFLEGQINLKGFFRVIYNTKWIFIITFIIILAFGLVYTFIVAPEYGSSSQIKISDDEIYYNDDLYKYFPAEASNLWIFKDYNRINSAVGKLDPITSELKSDSVLSEIIEKANLEITPYNLYRSIDIYIDRSLGSMTITVYLKSKELSYQTNKVLLETYINSKRSILEDAYSDLLSKLESRLEGLDSELENLSAQAQESAVEFGIMWYGELEKFGLEKIEISFVDPVLERNIETKYEEYKVLDNIRQNLTDNKDFFINRIEVIQSPKMSGIQDNSNYLRNILLSLAAAILAGIIVSFVVNYFKSRKNL